MLNEEISFYRFLSLCSRFDMCMITSAKHEFHLSRNENIERLKSLKSDLISRDYSFVRARGVWVPNYENLVAEALANPNSSVDEVIKKNSLLERNFIVINTKHSANRFFKEMEMLGKKYQQEAILFLIAGDINSAFGIDLTTNPSSLWYLWKLGLGKSEFYTLLGTGKNKVAFHYLENSDTLKVIRDENLLQEVENKFSTHFFVNLPCNGIITSQKVLDKIK